MDNNYSAFSAQFFEYKSYYITCSRKNDWTRHLLTSKHINNANGREMDETIPQQKPTSLKILIFLQNILIYTIFINDLHIIIE